MMGRINEAMTRAHVWITGEVHGINFREKIKKRADKYGVSGFAKNYFDEREKKVEVVLEGKRWAVMKVREWIELGEISGVKNIIRIRNYNFKWEPFRNEFKGREFEIR